MLSLAIKEQVDIVIMMDTSAACGSQVIYDGNRFADNKLFPIGMGVCAAQLHKNGFIVMSHRDFASLELLFSKIDSTHKIDQSKTDHHETEWYKAYFKQ